MPRLPRHLQNLQNTSLVVSSRDNDEIKPNFTLEKYTKIHQLVPEVKIELLSPHAKVPVYAHSSDVCADIFSIESPTILSGHTKQIRTGVRIELPEGWGCLIKEKSGLASQGVQVLGGVIDNGYRGEIIVILHNSSERAVYIDLGQKIAQLRFTPFYQAQFILNEVGTNTDRGENGFGSSGK